jgi:hypothetical protein
VPRQPDGFKFRVQLRPESREQIGLDRGKKKLHEPNSPETSDPRRSPVAAPDPAGTVTGRGGRYDPSYDSSFGLGPRYRAGHPYLARRRQEPAPPRRVCRLRDLDRGRFGA